MSVLADAWDAAADTFDREPDHGLSQPGVRAAWSARLSTWMPVPPARVLDLGCGTGSLSLLLAEHGHRPTSLDLSARMAARARAKLAEAGFPARVLVADAGDPPVAGEGFDVILARHLLWTLPDPHTALERWLRLLRPDGRLVLIEGRWAAAAEARPYPAGPHELPWSGGVGADELCATLRPLVGRLRLDPLPDPRLWGRRVDDERYAVVAEI